MVVSDYQMPGENGIQLLRSLRDAGSSIPFILMTGKGREEVVIEALNHGADSYLQKGGAPEPLYIELEHRIRAAVRRSRAEKQLMESESFHRTLLSNISSGVVIIDPSTRVIESVNEVAAAMFGAPMEMIVGHRCHSYLCPAQEGECPICDLHQEVDSSERILLTANGRRVPILKTVRRTNIEGHEKLLECIIDIGPRKNAEQEVERALSLLRSTVESTADGILVVDSAGVILLANANFREMWHIPAQVMQQNDDASALAQVQDLLVDPEGFLRKVRHLYETPSEVSFDVMDLKDGRVFERFSQPLRRGDSIAGRVWSFRDVTERHRMQETLADSEERFRQIFNHANDAIRVHEVSEDNKPGRFIDVNDTACSMLGYTREEMLQMQPSDISTGHFDPPLPQISRTLGQQGRARFETEHIHKNGEIIPVEVNAHIATLLGRRLTIAVVRDISERKRADEELRKTKVLYDSLAARIRVGIYLLRSKPGEALRLEYVSPRFAEIIGKSVDHLLEDFDHVFSAVHPADIDRLLALSAECTREMRPYLWEGRLLVRGEVRWIQIESIPEALQQGEALWHGMVLDITERKAAEERLRQSEQKFLTTIDRSSDGVVVFDRRGSILEWNASLTRMFGRSRAEMLGTPVWVFQQSLLPEGSELRAPLEAMEKRALAFLNAPDFSRVQNNEFEVRDREGRIRFVQVSMFPISAAGEGLFCAIVRDMTEERQAEAALRESEQKYRFIADNMAEVVVVLDMDMRVTYATPSVQGLLGYSVEESMSAGVEDIMTPASLLTIRKVFEDALASWGQEGGIQQLCLELEERKKDGTLIWVSNSMTFVQDKYGEPIAIISVSHDITERKMAEAALREANRKLNLLSSITRHDINNQMMVLSGELGLLEKRHPEVARDERLRKAKVAAESVSAMIQFTKAYEDIGVKAPTWHHVRELIAEAGGSSNLGGIKLANDVADDVEIFSDPLCLKVFCNLLDNVAKHSGHASTVRFRLLRQEGGHALVCEDDGVGVSAQMKEKIFLRRPDGDHGIGLFLSREILAITGISITEEGIPGSGARFVMRVPAEALRCHDCS